jgi:hypothetical protein
MYILEILSRYLVVISEPSEEMVLLECASIHTLKPPSNDFAMIGIL